MMKFSQGFSIVVGLLSVASAGASEVHEHGAGRLDIAVDGAEVTIHLESPLDSLLGFERAPRDDQERLAVRRMADALRKADDHFVLPKAAGCVATRVVLASAAIAPDLLGEKPGAGAGAHEHAQGEQHAQGEHHGHAELDGDFTFRCTTPANVNGLSVGLFKSFPRFERLDAQVAGPRGQSAAKLTPKQPELRW